MDKYTLNDTQRACVPFSPEGLKFLGNEASWDTLTESEEAREIALHRIKDACDINEDLTPLVSNYSTEDVLLSYPLSRIIVSSIGNPFLKHLYVLSEAKRVVSHTTEIWSETTDPSEKFTNLQLLDHLGIEVEITNGNHKIPTQTYNSILPTEVQNKFVKSDQIILENSDEVDTVLYWKCVQLVNENLPVRVPETFTDEFEDVLGTITGVIPPEFQLTKRGTGEELSYSSFSKVSELFPAPIQKIGGKIRNNEFVSDVERNLFIKSLLDCNIDAEKIIDWMKWDSKFTKSFGSDLVYSLQGEITTQELGIHTGSVTELQQNGVIHQPSQLFKLSEYPCIYALLNDADKLMPMNIRDKNL